MGSPDGHAKERSFKGMSMKRLRNLATVVAAVALLVSCGPKHKAEGIVKDFLNNSLKSTPGYVECGRLASTTRIDDQALSRLQKASLEDPIFKQPIAYGAYKELGELLYMRTKIVIGKDTLMRTIYLHPELREDGVMAVKEN